MFSERPDIVVLGFYVGSDAIGAARPYSWACWCAQSRKRTVILSGPFRPLITSRSIFLTHIVLSSPFFSHGSLAYRYLSSILYSRLILHLRGQLKKLVVYCSKNASFVRSTTELIPRLRSGLFSYRMPCLADLWHPFVLFRLFILRPKIVIASHSPYVSFLIGCTYKVFNPSSKLVVDYRDMWTLSRVYTGIPLFRSIERLLERFVLKFADKIVVVSQGQSSVLSSLDSTIAPCVIRNSSSIETFSVLDNLQMAALSPSQHKFSLLYAGTLYPSFQDPEPIFHTIQLLHQNSLIAPDSFCFEILTSQRHEFSSLAERYGLTQYVNLSPILSRIEYLDKMKAATCFLLLENALSESQGVMTSKLYDYLIVGRPIWLHGVSPDSELHQYASANGLVVDTDSFVSLVTSFYSGFVPYVPSFSQAEASRHSLMSLIDELSFN